jgi:hypothetical protein
MSLAVSTNVFASRFAMPRKDDDVVGGFGRPAATVADVRLPQEGIAIAGTDGTDSRRVFGSARLSATLPEAQPEQRFESPESVEPEPYSPPDQPQVRVIQIRHKMTVDYVAASSAPNSQIAQPCPCRLTEGRASTTWTTTSNCRPVNPTFVPS